MNLPRPVVQALLAPYLAVFYPLIVARRVGTRFVLRRPWHTWVTPNLLLGGFMGPGDVATFKKLGIGAVVNVSLELFDPKGAIERAGMHYLRIPCWDMRPPTIEEAEKGVAFIEGELAAGRKVYVHCASGVGRSVTIALCYLVTHQAADLGDAIKDLTARRPSVALSPKQLAFLERYLAHHRAKVAGESAA